MSSEKLLKRIKQLQLDVLAERHAKMRRLLVKVLQTDTPIVLLAVTTEQLLAAQQVLARPESIRPNGAPIVVDSFANRDRYSQFAQFSVEDYLSRPGVLCDEYRLDYYRRLHAKL